MITTLNHKRKVRSMDVCSLLYSQNTKTRIELKKSLALYFFIYYFSPNSKYTFFRIEFTYSGSEALSNYSTSIVLIFFPPSQAFFIGE